MIDYTKRGIIVIGSARSGSHMTCDMLKKLWETFSNDDPAEGCIKLDHLLKNKLGLPITLMDPDASKFFKHHYKSVFKNKGPMIRE